MHDSLSETLNEIKKRLWFMMDGVTATSLREKDSSNELTLGLSIPQLRDLAKDYPSELELSKALLQRKSREMKILGLMLYPIEKLDSDVLSDLIEALPTNELLDQLAFNLLAVSPTYPSLVESLLKINDKKVLYVVFTATSRRVRKGHAIPEETLIRLLDIIDDTPLTPQSINLLYILQEDGKYQTMMTPILHGWQSNKTDKQKTAFAVEWQDNLNL